MLWLRRLYHHNRLNKATRDIAIIGFAGRFPGANSIEQYWENLCSGKESITFFSADELIAAGISENLINDPNYIKAAPIIDNVDLFDAHFFQCSPREAEVIDPQQRLLLECAWEVLEKAGYSPQNYHGAIGVFSGAGGIVSSYFVEYLKNNFHIQGSTASTEHLGNDKDFLSTRISYKLDLKGPSIDVQTACSTSLVTVHLACQSIINGECDMALAGGVSIRIPQKSGYLWKKGDIFSADGHCRPFDANAQGIVFGSGVGLVLLKRLDKAINDNDRIYAVIKGSAINNDGGHKVSYLASSAIGQIDCITAALNVAEVDPKTISYVEAHGTGTIMGDPVEVSALTQAFRKNKNNNRLYCGIGSVKSNIGHLDTASGIAGLIKAILILHHKKIPPSINFETPNPKINFQDSPFYVNNKLIEWPRTNHVKRVGVNSLGIGGTNAFVILEEAPVKKLNKRKQYKPYYLIALSAKTENALRQKIIDLAAWLDVKTNTNKESLSLEEISYTLNNGRSHFDKRCAMVVDSLVELNKTLKMILQNQKPSNVFDNHGKHKNLKNKLLVKEKCTRLFQKLKNKKISLISYRLKLEALAKFYVDGYELNWELLHQNEERRTILLPTYPFQKKSYWLPSSSISSASKLHLLIDTNLSTLTKECFGKTLSGNEFYLMEHQINNVPILPGVVHLEMIRAAGSLANPENKVIGLRNVVWTKPIQGLGQQTIFINIYPDELNARFEIIDAGKTENCIHSQGRILYSTNEFSEKKQILDISAIKDRCIDVKSSNEIYSKFIKLGFYQGPNFQVIQQFYSNQQEALSLLSIPVAHKDQFDKYGLDIRLLDGAVQTALGVLEKHAARLYVPFSIGEMRIEGYLPEKCYVHVVMNLESIHMHSPKFDMQISDEIGSVLVDIKNFVVRELYPDSISQHLYYYHPIWKEQALAKNIDPIKFMHNPILIFGDEQAHGKLFDNKFLDQKIIRVLLGSAYQRIKADRYSINESSFDDFSHLLRDLAERKTLPKYILYEVNKTLTPSSIHDEINKTYYPLFYLTQALIQQKLTDNIRLLFINKYSTGSAMCFRDALSGFAKTLHLEYPKLFIQIINMDNLTEYNLDNIVNEFDCEEVEIKFQQQSRLVKRYHEIIVKNIPEPKLIKIQGVYLITGGLGGLGTVFARYLAKHYQAKLILTGRSTLNEKHGSIIAELEQLGSEVVYFQSDISNRDHVLQLMKNIKNRFGELNGLIHAAGVTQDAFIKKKSTSEVDAVFAPKIFGAINLDEVTKSEPLDFFIMFSSISAIFGNVGQADYSYANAFMDSFAEYRHQLQIEKQRQGITISINWPVWLEGGMQIDDHSKEWMDQAFGLSVLTTNQGETAFQHILAQKYAQQIVLLGNKAKFEKKLRISNLDKPNRINGHQEMTDNLVKDDINKNVLIEKILAKVMAMVAELLKIDIQSLHPNEDLGAYGIDSVSLTALSNQLNQYYGLELTPAILFEHNTLKSFARYLIDEFPTLMQTHFAKEISDEKRNQQAIISTAKLTELNISANHEQRYLSKNKRTDRIETTDIAIIGIGGQFPESSNLNIFWDNLIKEKDLITEIPKSRWDWRFFYGDESENKTKVKWGGFIQGVDQFDAGFFKITPREAELMDPQQRLFLQTVWKTIEDAGYLITDLHNTKTGLFVGVFGNDYAEIMQQTNMKSAYSTTGVFHSILANRVSYLLNITGPSEAIDTACSSSLVAIHQAVMAICNGDCEMAIAGGVNLILTPTLHIEFSQAGMLSEDGRCKTFDKSANGYVRGEGVGAILLKPLSKALADKDIIYGVIKGSAVNHGGHVSSLTVPNPNLQAELIVSAMERAKVDVDTVSYIEMHGTGTPLGDPIEVNGLIKAFHLLEKKQDKNVPFNNCGLGSVKTNIGHLESAAGIASVIKVLLAMRHKKLPGLANFNELNPHIKIDKSPFYIVTKTQEWNLLKNKLGDNIPRRAGISSFGFGGANAHIVIEEPPITDISMSSSIKPCYLITLSAKTDNSLKERIAELSNWFTQESIGSLSIEDISYTLNAKREHYENRCAFVVDSVFDLMNTLTLVLNGQKPANYLLRLSNDKSVHEPIFIELLSKLLEDLSHYQELDTINYQRKLLSVANLYIRGYDINWNNLHQGESKKKIALPGYAFEKKSYWIDTRSKSVGFQEINQNKTPTLHPLLDKNESTFERQIYEKTFYADAFFFKDHHIQGQAVLPGAVYIELIFIAGCLAANRIVRTIKEILWQRPIIIEQSPKEIYIELFTKNKDVTYQIYSKEDNQRSVYCEGQLGYEEQSLEKSRLDLDSVRERCDQVIAKDILYQQFNNIGFQYGLAFQAIEKVYKNNKEVLAELILPVELEKTANAYTLHPSLLDAALSTGLCLYFGNNEKFNLRIPFSLDEIDVFKSVTNKCYVYTTFSAQSTEDLMDKCDITIFNEDGEIAVLIKGYAGRIYKKPFHSQDAKLLLYAPQWLLTEINETKLLNRENWVIFAKNDIPKKIVESSLVNKIIWIRSGIEYKQLSNNEYCIRPNYIKDYQKVLIDLKKKNINPNYYLHLWNIEANDNWLYDDEVFTTSVNESIYSLYYLFQALDALGKSKDKLRILFVFNSPAINNQPQLESVIGLIHSLKINKSNWQVATLQVDVNSSIWPDQVLQEFAKSNFITNSEIRYQQGQRFLRQLKEMDNPIYETITESPSSLVYQGVYLITGGLGGLGKIFAKYLANQYQAKLVLMGRRPFNAEINQQLEELRNIGSQCIYLQGDVSKLADVKKVIEQIKIEFGHLNGILHMAGIINTTQLIENDSTEFSSVLAPKVIGTRYLDSLTRNESLDFFVVFSSIAAEIGDFGVGSYAVGNRFMDSYMAYREKLRYAGKRQGKSLSINWPYWQVGGMKLLKEEESIYFEHAGMQALDQDEAIQIFNRLLLLPSSQVFVLKGAHDKAELVLGINQEKFKEEQPSPVLISKDKLNLLEETANYLQNVFARITKIPVNEIDSRKPLEAYGIDSLMILNFNRELSKDFQNLRKTLLFEHRTLESLAQYLINEQFSQLARILNRDKNNDVIEEKVMSKDILDSVNTLPTKIVLSNTEENIAVIGMNGRYPQANNLDEFWENLTIGRDSIIEIPKERWDYVPYYDPEKGKLGKTYSKWGSFIQDADKFDAAFFNISPREAEQMDPQDRLLLQSAWATMEDAGYNPYFLQQLSKGRIGVFIGVMWNEYQLLKENISDLHTFGNSNNGSLANRISYFFDFHGPSVVIDTMCSSSLVAIHMACESILRNECDYAIAGGVNLSLHPSKYINMSQMSLLSRKGQCKSFGEGGEGYVPGEGVGTVLLKPLSKAIKDGDIIYGVIKGSYINHGGKTNGFTVPNPDAQAELIKGALSKANIKPESLSYIEAHGTGTALGDPIEVTGLTKAFGEKIATQSCPIGSVKSNIGHLEGAAGIVALTKVLLQLKYKQLVPSIHAEILNPHIDFSTTPFYVQRELTEWKPIQGYLRRAGISSFGAGGTNAHVIVEEAPIIAEPLKHTIKPFYLITLSAKTDESLRQRIIDLKAWLEKNSQACLIEDVSYTLNIGRAHFEKRCAFVVSSLTEMQETLEKITANSAVPKNVFINLNNNQIEQDKIKRKELNINDFRLDNESSVDYYNKLLDFANKYVEGYDINWEHFYLNEPTNKISLPTYPFSKDHYWFSKAKPELNKNIKLNTTEDKSNLIINHVNQKTILKTLPSALNNIQSLENKNEAKKDSAPTLTLQEKNRDPIEKETVIEKIKHIVSDVLYIPVAQIQLNKNFAEMGVDSVLAVEIIKKVNEQFLLNVLATKLYDYTTPELLANYIYNLLPLGYKEKSAAKAIETINSATIDLPQIKESVAKTKRAIKSDIAIIGIACQFPGANNIKEFWENLSQGKSSIVEIPKERWSIAEFYDADPSKPNKSYSKWGGFLEDVDQFDPLFFSISPSEANWMDPQQRLILQTAWSALEDAGYSNQLLSNKVCGMYVGVMNNDYSELIATHTSERNAQQMIGNSHAILAARISYFLNLKGPAITIDTACSSSLVALHLACKALEENEIHMALVGGVTLYLTETPYIGMSKAEMLSPEGKSKTFDNTADGFVPGEGVGVVLLKRLEDAVEDHDHIYGVIKGSGINQDGTTNGITAPSAISQKELELSIYKRYEINPETISYVEAHGTGTKLGDPIEVEALTNAFRVYTDKKQYCAIGSVKTNIGHTSAASGIASLIKVILCLQNKNLVPSLHFSIENEYIHFKNTPFFVNTAFQNWETILNQPRRAAISSFGFSGTNAHAIVDEAPPREFLSLKNKPVYLVTLSAKTKHSLKQKLLDLEEWLKSQTKEPSLENISYTLNTGRTHFEKRVAIVVGSIAALLETLQQLNEDINTKLNHVFINLKGEDKAEDQAIFKELFKLLMQEISHVDQKSLADYQEKLLALANFYIKGYVLDWDKLHQNESKQRISLPTYPFQKKRFWIKEQVNKIRPSVSQQKPASTDVTADVVSQFYDGLLRETKKNVDKQNVMLLTFAPFRKRVRGFSWSQLFINGKNKELLFAAQKEMREIIFRHVNFNKCKKVLDFGCGYGYDLVMLAKRYSHLQLDGYTISKQQADEAINNIKKNNLVNQIIIYHRDSAVDTFPNQYDVIFGFEVAHHIKNKQALFANISQHMHEGGKLLLADFISHEDFSIEHEKTSSYFITKKEWVNVLSEQNLQLIECIDVTQEICNFLYDTDFEKNFETIVNPAVRDAFYSYKQLEKLLNQKMASYVLLSAVKQFSSTAAEITRHNEDILNHLIPYKEISNIDKWFYNTIWTELPRGPASSRGEHILIISDKSTAKLNLLLKDKMSAYSVIINSTNKNELLDFIHNAINIDAIKNVIYLCPIPSDDKSNVIQQHQQVCLNFLNLVKVFMETCLLAAPKLWFVTKGAQIVDDDNNQIYLPHSSIAAMAKTVAAENPLFSCVTLDLDMHFDDEQASNALVNVLLSETNEKQIAARGDSLKVAKLQRIYKEDFIVKKSIIIHEHATCLISGGLGDIGLNVMKWFIEQGLKYFLLLGRSSPSRSTQEMIDFYKNKGIEIHTAQVDISDVDQLNAILMSQFAKETLPPIRYVIHAAGTIKDATIINQSEETFNQVFHPKVIGAWNLHELTQTLALELECFVLFSSAASILGSPGQINYSAANGFLDSLAQYRRQLNLPGLSINWGAWSGMGMSSRLGDKERLVLIKNGIYEMGLKQGLTAFGLALRSKESNLMIAPIDWRRYCAVRNSIDIIQEPISEGKSSDHIKDMIRHNVSQITEIDLSEINDTTLFSEMGIDSVMMINLRNRLQAEIGDQYKIPSNIMHDYPTIALLAEILKDKCSISISKQTAFIQTQIIHPKAIKRIPLSYGQQRMYFAYKLDPNIPSYNCSVSLSLEGELDIEALKITCLQLINRHSELRSVFYTQAGEIYSDIIPETEYLFDFKMVNTKENKLDDLIRHETQQLFDLSKGPLIRFVLIKLSLHRYVLMIIFHHIILDGMSLHIIIREWSVLYNAQRTNNRVSLPKLSIQFADFVYWQQEWIKSDDAARQLEYWKKILLPLPEILHLPTDKVRQSLSRHVMDMYRFNLSLATVDRLQKFNQEFKIPFYAILMSVYQMLLSRYAKQNNFIVGVLAAGRTHPEVENVVGFFLNILPILADLNGNPSFIEFTQRVNQNYQSALINQDIPIEIILSELKLPRQIGVNPLFQTVFVYQNFLMNDVLEFIDIQSSYYDANGGWTNDDIVFEVRLKNKGIEIIVKYNTELFNYFTIEKMSHDFVGILDAYLENPDKSIEIEKSRAIIAASFSSEPIASSLQFWMNKLNIPMQVSFAPYNQIFQELLNTKSELRNNTSGLNIILGRLEDWLTGSFSYANLLKIVEEFLAAISAYASQSSIPLLVYICPPSPQVLEKFMEKGQYDAVENKIEAALQEIRGVFFISRKIINLYHVSDYYDPITDVSGHIPYTPLFFTAMGTALSRKIAALLMSPYKVIVLDGDNTLWSGILGEDGVMGVKVTQPYLALQEFMLKQYEAGMLLCLVSKNNEKDVLEFFDQHPDLPLKKSHFISWRVNWQTKSDNIKELANELQLGLDSFIFIDDNIMECEEVRANCPDALTLQLPDPEMIFKFLQHVWAFDHVRVTDTDKERSLLYQQNLSREKLRKTTASFQEFLANLKLDIRISPMTEANILRVSQLTQRTNQFNTTTIRKKEAEISMNDPCLVVHVEDRFGSYGLVGVVFYKIVDKKFIIENFLLSCRVLGKGVEHKIMNEIGFMAKSKQCSDVVIQFRTTERNIPAKRFLDNLTDKVFDRPTGLKEYYLSAENAQKLSMFESDVSFEEIKPIEYSSSTQNVIRTDSLTIQDIATKLITAQAIFDNMNVQLLTPRDKMSILVAPRSDTETQIAYIFSKLLHLDEVSVEDNFFDMGGTSIMLVRAQAELQLIFKKDIPLLELFNHPTVASLARYLLGSQIQNDKKARGLLELAARKTRRKRFGKSVE